jgi:Rps23 Pro-64 3,4-dihydroxylase Tpa1-like proline 4-hydroxylase
MNPLDLTTATVRLQPFPCFTIAQVVSEKSEQELLKWLESEAPWRLAVMDFYEQYEFDFKDVSLPENLKPLFSENTLNQLREKVGLLLGASLKPLIDITAHKLNRTQKIRIHNDARHDGESHRFLIQLNRGWDESNGGLLMLFHGPEVETLDDIIPPTSRSAFGFEISTSSYHAVSQVHHGDRYTLVFSFYAHQS